MRTKGGGGPKIQKFCGRHKWKAPKEGPYFCLPLERNVQMKGDFGLVPYVTLPLLETAAAGEHPAACPNCVRAARPEQLLPDATVHGRTEREDVSDVDAHH